MNNMPLAALIRPRTLDEVIGQDALLGKDKPLRNLIESDKLKSIILYGPAGTGKSTLAEIITNTTKLRCVKMNATSISIKDIRKEGDVAHESGERAIIFIDEVHRLTSVQADSLLPYTEAGDVIFIGATTENPFFTIIGPLISRSHIFKLEPLNKKALVKVLLRGVQHYREEGKDIALPIDSVEHIIRVACGDARKALSILEMAVELMKESQGDVTLELVTNVAPSKYVIYGDDAHYDLASWMQGAIQASDPDSAVFALAKWLESGEDPRFIARRVLISASEDAFSNPLCVAVAHAAFTASEKVGRPECDILLAQAVIMTAQSKRDKTAANAIWEAVKDVKDGIDIAVPKAMRDSSYHGAKQLGHGSYAKESYVGIQKKYIKEI
jgi:putative ATPase